MFRPWKWFNRFAKQPCLHVISDQLAAGHTLKNFIYLGGLSSGGLGFTDTGNKEVIGGISKEFYQHLSDHYQKDDAWRWQAKSEYGNKGQHTVALDGETSSMWIFEPHVAEKVFEDLIDEHQIEVHRETWLDRAPSGISVENGKILSFSSLLYVAMLAEVV